MLSLFLVANKTHQPILLINCFLVSVKITQSMGPVYSEQKV